MANVAITEMSAADALTNIELLEVSQPSASIKRTATTISAVASGNHILDSGNGFITAGLAVGDRVKVSGFTGNTANNHNIATILTLSAGDMTVDQTMINDAAGESVTVAKWVTKRTNVDDLGLLARPIESWSFALSDEATPITTGTNKLRWRAPFAIDLTEIPRISLSVTQTGSGGGGLVTVDVNETGSTMLSTKLTIDNGEKTSTTAAAPAVMSDSHIANDAEISWDIDVVGDGTAAGLKFTFIGRRSLT